MKSKRKAAINCSKKILNSFKEISEGSSEGSAISNDEDIFVGDDSDNSEFIDQLSSSDNCEESDIDIVNEIDNEPDKIINVVDNYHRSEEPVSKSCFIGNAPLLLRAQHSNIDNGLGLLRFNFQKNFNYFNQLSQSAYWADKILIDGDDELDVFFHLNEGFFPNKGYLNEIENARKIKEVVDSLSSINILQSETDLRHELLKPLSSISVPNPVVDQHGVFINTGSYVKRMCWAPINSQLFTDQFLAVSVYKELTDRIKISESTNQSGHMIQIFNCGPLTMKTKRANPSKLEMVLTHSWGKVTDMSWSPQPLPAVSRLEKLIGHLALCCSDGFIRIIPISKSSNPGCLVTLNNNHPVLCLGSVRAKENVSVYPTTLHWRQEFPDKIVAGYNTGNIALYALEASVLATRSRIVGVDVYLKPSMFRRVFHGPVRSIQFSPFNWQLISCSSLSAASAVIVDLGQPPDVMLPSPIDLEATVGSQIIWPIPGDVIVLAAGKHLYNKPGVHLCSASKPAKRSRKLPLRDVSSIDLSQSLNVVPIGTRSGQLRLLSLNTDYIINLLKNKSSERKSRERQIDSAFYFQYRLTEINQYDEAGPQVKTEQVLLPSCRCPANLQCVHKLISRFSISISKNCNDELNDWQLDSMLNINEISTNPNPGSSTWISVALECGLIHIVPLTHFYRPELDEMSNGSSCCVLNAAAAHLINEVLLPKSISYLTTYGRPRKYPPGTNHSKVYRQMGKNNLNKKNLITPEHHSLQEPATSNSISECLPHRMTLRNKTTYITDYFMSNCHVSLEKSVVQIPLSNASEKSKSPRKECVNSSKTKPNNVKCSTPKNTKAKKQLKIIQESTPIKKVDDLSNTSIKTRLRSHEQSMPFSSVSVKNIANSTVPRSTSISKESTKPSSQLANTSLEDMSNSIRTRLRSSTDNQNNSSKCLDLANSKVSSNICITKTALPLILSPKNKLCSFEHDMKLARSSSDRDSVKSKSPSFESTSFEDITCPIRTRLRSHDKELNSSVTIEIGSLNKTVESNNLNVSFDNTFNPLRNRLRSQNEETNTSTNNPMRNRLRSQNEETNTSTNNPMRNRLRSQNEETNTSTNNEMSFINHFRKKKNSIESNVNSSKKNNKQIRKRPISHDKTKRREEFIEVLTRKRSPSYESSEFNVSLDHQEVEPARKRLRPWEKHDVSSCSTSMKKSITNQGVFDTVINVSTETNVTKNHDFQTKFSFNKMYKSHKYFETNKPALVESVVQSSSLSINDSLFSNDEKLSMSPVIIVENINPGKINSFDKRDSKEGKSNEMTTIKLLNVTEPNAKLNKENISTKSKFKKKSEKIEEKSISENQIINVVEKESKSIKSKNRNSSSKSIKTVANSEKETVIKPKRKSRKIDERTSKLSNDTEIQESKSKIITPVSDAQYKMNDNALTSSPLIEKPQKSHIKTVPFRRFLNTDIDEEEDYVQTTRVVGSVSNKIMISNEVKVSEIDISKSETPLRTYDNAVTFNSDKLKPISQSTPTMKNVETEVLNESLNIELKKNTQKIKESKFKNSEELKLQKKEAKKSKTNLINEQKLKKLQDIFSSKRKELFESQSNKETIQCPPPVSIDPPASNSKGSWWGQESQQNNDQNELDLNKIDDLSLKNNFLSPKKKTNINASLDDRMDKIKQVINRGISQCDLDENIVENDSPELLQPFRPLKMPKSLNNSLSFNS